MMNYENLNICGIVCVFSASVRAHLGVIVDIDHIYRPVTVADEEDRVLVRLQHLKKVHIRAAVDEHKVLKLKTQTTCLDERKQNISSICIHSAFPLCD